MLLSFSLVSLSRHPSDIRPPLFILTLLTHAPSLAGRIDIRFRNQHPQHVAI